MKRFLIALVALPPLAVNAASISKFSSISVSATNFQSEAVVTNGLTLGGVRNTSWPAGGIVGTVSNNVASAGLLAVDSTKTNGIAATFAHVTNALGVAVSQAELGYVSGVTSAIQTQLNAKAPLASPALTGTPTINGASIETQLTNKVAKTGGTDNTGTLYFPIFSGGQFQSICSSNTQSGTWTCAFDSTNYNVGVLTGAVTIASSNLATNRTWRGELWNTQATNCAVTWPTGWGFAGGKPTYVEAGQKLLLRALCTLNANDTNVTAIATVTQ